jgi:pimeloyl-ACP methyl ester carboxylesterase
MPIAQLNGQGIFYEDSGGDDKPALVFMHGFLFNQSMFDPQVEALKDDYRCVRFDARALGQTEWDGEPFTLYDTVADCIGLMDHLNIKTATIIGMSQGGYAAFRVALKHPDRVDGLVFMSTTQNIDSEDFKVNYTSVRDAWRKSGDAPSFILDNMMMLFLGPKEEYPQLWEIWRPQFEKVNGEQVFHGMNNLLERDDLTDEMMQKLTMPSLVIHGQEDRGMPIMLGERVFKSLPNAKKMVRVPGAAHAANLMKPDVVNAALREFLETHVYTS